MSNKSLAEILDVFKKIDDDMPPEDFDPAEVVGDLKDKIDAIKWRLDSWKAQAKALDEDWISKLKDRRDSIMRKHEKLTDYLTHQMLANGYQILPGTLFKARIQATKKVDVQGDPTPEMYLKHKDIIRQKVYYAWDKKALKVKLEAGEEVPFATLGESKSVRFDTKKEVK